MDTWDEDINVEMYMVSGAHERKTSMDGCIDVHGKWGTYMYMVSGAHKGSVFCAVVGHLSMIHARFF
jgi:hypothetical protein